MCMRFLVLIAVLIKESSFVCDCLCAGKWLLTFHRILAHSPSAFRSPHLLGLGTLQVNIADNSPAV